MISHKNVLLSSVFAFALLFAGCDVESDRLSVDNWPKTESGTPLDPVVEARIDSLMAVMTLEEKVGQTIQADINSITPADILDYPLGSVLNGGNSAPGANNKAAPAEWLALADEYWEVSTTRSGAAIPILWGTDAVHGHNNIVGATVFPHNIGLGAANNPDLIRDIGSVTARETRVTGQDWTFAPTLAVVRDDRWGRTYEGYSEDPDIVARYSGSMVEGLQGSPGDSDFLTGDHVISTAKHFLGDGGTVNGVDQGDNVSSEADLSRIHGAGYPPAIEEGVQTVMASFSSWKGEKMHGSAYLLTDVLKNRMGFNGFVVGDWNGHGQVPGCTSTSCAASLNAGVDMFMAPDSWKDLFAATLEQAESGEISEERLDDAVRRILRVKFRTGLFETGAPSTRAFAGEYELIGAPDHLAIARQAVRESLVLLKNENQTLPINPQSNVLVVGDGADNIGKQSGGWTLNWQGTGHANSDFPNGESIWKGIQSAVAAAGGSATLSVDGSYQVKPDIAIVVFGEDPYAEFQGDRPDLMYESETSNGLQMLAEFSEAGIPTVSVFLSGRPMWVNREINKSDAFVASWLPGTQGGGVADVIIANPDGSANHDFKGKLSFSWPALATQTLLNVGDENYDPLFAYGYGLTYEEPSSLEMLAEDSGRSSSESNSLVLFSDGVISSRLALSIESGGESTEVGSEPVSVDGIRVGRMDRYAQEDAIHVTSTGGAGVVVLSGDSVDYTRESNGDMALAIEFRVDESPVSGVSLGMGCGEGCSGTIDVSNVFGSAQAGEWSRADILLSCFAAAGTDMSNVYAPFRLSMSDPAEITISSLRVVPNEGGAVCPK
ncbi:MAG: exo 1,3/1,4-beta-D-glucan glucohydrolase [Rhodothermales bacterium]|nr:exo 1,3/1,4-beta-D-glucan glucohydrolase [Rhodothermales bacterium]